MCRTLTLAEVADRYGVGERTVAAWVRAGELRAVDVGRRAGGRKARLRITSDALAQFEALRAPTPAPPRARRRRPAGDVIKFY